MRRGVKIPWQKWAVDEGLKGFHERMPARLDQQYLANRVLEVTDGLRKGEYLLPFSQDPVKLVAAGHFISPAFFVDKAERREVKGREWNAMTTKQQNKLLRLIANMKRANKRVRDRRCRMRGLQGVPYMAQKGVHTHMSSADVVGAYKMVGLNPENRKHATLDYGPSMPEGMRFVEMTTLPMGYKLSVFVFQRIMLQAVKKIRAAGIPVVVWLDDLLFFHTGVEAGKADQVVIRRIMEEHFGKECLHPDKGEGWGPEGPVTFMKKHLGTAIDLDRGSWLTTKDTVNRLSDTAGQILRSQARNQRWLGARWIAEFAGLGISTYLSNKQALFRCRPMHDFLVDCRVHELGYGVRGKATRALIRSLEWFKDLKNNDQVRKSIWKEPVAMAWATDASKRGQGGLDHAVPLSQCKVGEEMGVPTLGIWSEAQSKEHITKLELRAVDEKLKLAAKKLRIKQHKIPDFQAAAKHLFLWEDNSAAVSILNKLYTKSRDLWPVLESIVNWLDVLDWTMTVRYIASAENPADWFSRCADKADWGFAREVLQQLGLLTRWGPVTVDRFADRKNNVVPRFNSGFPCRGTEAIDAFSVEWKGELNWINPPWSKMGQALAKLAGEGAAAVVIAPRWHSAEWWPVLQRIAVDSVVVHDRQDASSTLRDQDFLVGEYLAQVGKLPEPLRNRGWKIDAYYVPESSLALVTPQTPS